MSEFTNDERDVFREAYQMYQNDGEEIRLDKKYRIKSFYEENKIRRKVAFMATFILGSLSVLTGLYYGFKWLNIVINVWWVSVIISIGLLSIWEYGKRDSVSTFFTKWARKKNAWFSKTRFIASLFFIIGSVFFSYNGGADLIRDLSFEPPKLDIDSIENKYIARIQPLQEMRAGYNNQDGVTMWDLRHKADSVDAQILVLEKEKSSKLKKAEDKNNLNAALFSTSKNVKAEHFGIFSGLCDLLLCVVFWFIHYSDDRVRGEMQKAKQVLDSKSNNDALSAQASTQKGIPGAAKPSESVQKHTSKRSVLTDTDSNKRLCVMCLTDISHRRKNAKTCSDYCRKELSKKKNGTEPMMRKAK